MVEDNKGTPIADFPICSSAVTVLLLSETPRLTLASGAYGFGFTGFEPGNFKAIKTNLDAYPASSVRDYNTTADGDSPNLFFAVDR